MARPASYDREEVLKKAMELFWSKGFNATSIKDLEQVLDMRPGSIYAAFGSKEGLFNEALALYFENSGHEFQRAMDGAVTPLAGLAAYIRNLGER
ncbi:MAG: helix-turn-helix domain-containing protein, partial [Pseudomonadota bacterium]